jgi:hypothetical protein
LLGDIAPIKDSPPSRFEVNFWKKLERNDAPEIEPDAQLIIYWEQSPPLVILFELKWDAPEGKDKNGKFQLDEQWNALKSSDCEAYHLFIAKNNAVAAVKKAINTDGRADIWKGRLICLTWDDIHRIYGNTVENDGRVVHRWAKLIEYFILCATGTRPFGGFGRSIDIVNEGFGSYSFPDFSALSTPIFWDDHWFARLNKLIPSELPLQQPLFFTENNHD